MARRSFQVGVDWRLESSFYSLLSSYPPTMEGRAMEASHLHLLRESPRRSIRYYRLRNLTFWTLPNFLRGDCGGGGGGVSCMLWLWPIARIRPLRNESDWSGRWVARARTVSVRPRPSVANAIGTAGSRGIYNEGTDDGRCLTYLGIGSLTAIFCIIRCSIRP